AVVITEELPAFGAPKRFLERHGQTRRKGQDVLFHVTRRPGSSIERSEGRHSMPRKGLVALRTLVGYQVRVARRPEREDAHAFDTLDAYDFLVRSNVFRVFLASFVLDQLHALLVDRICRVLCRCGEFSWVIDPKFELKETIEPGGCLRGRSSQLIASRDKSQQLVVVAFAKIVRDLVVRIFGPCEPCLPNLEVLEIIRKPVHMILVLVRYDN